MDFSPERQSYQIDTDDGGVDDVEDKSQEVSDTSKSAEEYSQKFEDISGLGEAILGHAGYTVRVDPSAQTFAFDHEKKEVIISPQLIEGEDLTEAEQEYVYSHEIGHFVQMMQDAEAYKDTFEKARREAEEYPKPQQKLVEKAWNRFFNIFLDVHDNSIVEYRVPRFYDGDEDPDHPRQKLYEKIFSESDLTSHPKHQQFIYAALRKAMLPDEPVEVSGEVAEILESPFSYLGNDYDSFHDFVKTDLFSPRTDIKTLLHRLKRTAEPIFRELLQDDVEDGHLEQPEGTGDILDTDEGLTEEAVDEIAEEIAEANKSPEEEMEEKMESEFEQEMQDAGFSEQEIDRMNEIMKSAGDVFRDLEDLWEVFLKAIKSTNLEMDDGYRSGKELSVDSFVRQLPDLLSNPDNLRLFKRRFAENTVEDIEPKKINLALALDLSSSMDTTNRRATQEAAYALAKSLIQFKRNIASRVGTEDIPLDIDLQFIGFGSETKNLLKAPTKQDGSLDDSNSAETDNQLWRAVLDIEKTDLGGTEDDKALQQILDNLNDQKTQKRLEEEKEVSVAIEITDGATETPESSSKLIQELNDIDNSYARGIRIPGGDGVDDTEDESDKDEVEQGDKTFESVWGKHGERLYDIQKLREVLTQILFAALDKR